MCRLLLLIALSCVLVVQAASNSAPTFTSKEARHIELLHDFTLSSGGYDLSSHRHHAMSTLAVQQARQHTTTTWHGLSVPHGDNIHLQFSAMGQHFSFPMRAYTELVSPHSTVEIMGAYGLIETIPMTLTSYIKMDDDTSADWASMTIHPDGTFHAVIHRDGEIYQVDPVDAHRDSMHAESHWHMLSTEAHARHGMTVFKHSDLVVSDDVQCGAVDPAYSQGSIYQRGAAHATTPMKVHTHQRRTLATFAGDVFSCGSSGPVGTVSIGAVADYGLFLRYKSDQNQVQSFIQSIYASANSVYTPQLATTLNLQTVVSYTQAGGDAFNIQPVRSGSRCDNGGGAVGVGSVTIDATLNALTTWVQGAKANQYTAWHQVTDCFPPSGVVGLAWVGVLCESHRAGVSGVSTTTWLTVAHETGHNFGASHTFQNGQGTTGGIMDYGDGKLNGVYQFNRQYSESEMCGVISQIRADPTGTRSNGGKAIQPYCWKAGSDAGTGGSGSTGGGSSGGTTSAPGGTTQAPPTNPPTTTKTYGWGVSSWATCSADCDGTQSRQVACLQTNAPTQTIVDDSLCSSAGAKPASSQSCGAKCAYTWVSTLTTPADCLSSTNTKCAAAGASTQGSQANPTKCVKTQNGAQVTVADSMCTAAKPATTLACTLPVCSTAATWTNPVFGTCSVQCGAGTQTRTISCVTTDSTGKTTVVADSQCTGTKPASSQACNTQACPPPGQRYTWEISAWTTCPATCGGAVQTRTAKCKDTQTNTYVANSNCPNAPTTSQSCNTQTCAPSNVWATSQPGKCSVTCGSGSAPVTVRCVKPNDSTFAAQPENTCDPTTKPATSVPCSLPPCTTGGGGSSNYRWVVTGYSYTCSWFGIVCNVASVNPPVCVNTLNQQVDASYCAGQSQTSAIAAGPQVGATCPGTNPCKLGGTSSLVVNDPNDPATIIPTATQVPTSNTTAPSWSASPFSECSAVCGGGIQTRNLTCVAPGGQVLPDSACINAPTVATQQPCNTLQCSAFWWTGFWSPCSQLCNGGLMTRDVQCRSTADATGAAVNETQCFGSPKPSITQSCNADPCPTWKVGDWSSCSAQCGDGGYQSRAATCTAVNGVEADVSLCADDSKPITNQTCYLGPCPTYDYGDWSPCSKLCGGGVQTRDVSCRLPANGNFPGQLLPNDTICAANDAYAQQYGPPIRSRSCNEQACPQFHYVITSRSFCSATCGGGQQTVTLACVNAQGQTTALSDCDGLDNKPDTTQPCNTSPCPTIFGWRTGNFSDCNVFCGAGQQTRHVFCINEATLETVDNINCEKLPGVTKPTPTQICQQPANTCWGGLAPGQPKAGRCDTGKCICRPGFSGRDCSIAPDTVNVQLPVNLYLAGVPQYENIVVSWTSTGNASRVSILIERTAKEWTEQYLARNIINTGKFEWSVGTHMKDLDFATNYTIRVWFKPGVYGDSPSFSIADPCQYTACGTHGRCSKGQCVCSAGWTGPTCAISPCAVAGCNEDHATCISTPKLDGTHATTCRCTDGWTGPQCRTPQSCTNDCKNGGDMIANPPLLNVTTGSCPVDTSASHCACRGGWTDNTCSTCSLQCTSGTPDSTCSKCVCPKGYTGTNCQCRYYSLKLNLYLDAREWIDVLIARTRFINTFSNDIAAALGLSSSTIQVQSLTIGAYGQLVVEFWLTEQCRTASADLIDFHGPHALYAAADGGYTITDIYQNLYQQFSDKDSTVNYGPVTNLIVPGSIQATDPLGSVLAQPPVAQDTFGGEIPAGADQPPSDNPQPTGATSSGSSINGTLIGIIVGASVGGLILAFLIIMGIRHIRGTSATKETINKMNQVGTSTQMVSPHNTRTLSDHEGKRADGAWAENPALVSVQQRMGRV